MLNYVSFIHDNVSLYKNLTLFSVDILLQVDLNTQITIFYVFHILIFQDFIN